MEIVAGLFRYRDRALEAVRALREAGFQERAVTLVASPTSAGETFGVAARELPRPGDGFADLGAVMGGQADPDFPRSERITVEERVAQGDTLVRVNASDGRAAERAEAILLRLGAERV